MIELCFLTNVSGEQWAAWTQAVLSALAIFASVALVNHQHRQELLRTTNADEARRVQHLRSLLQLVGGVHQVLAKIAHWAHPDPKATYLPGDIRRMEIELIGLVEALGKIDLNQFDEHKPIEAALTALSAGRLMLDCLHASKSDAPFVPKADVQAIQQRSHELGPPLLGRLNELHKLLPSGEGNSPT